jgi:hypothetical protein
VELDAEESIMCRKKSNSGWNEKVLIFNNLFPTCSAERVAGRNSFGKLSRLTHFPIEILFLHRMGASIVSKRRNSLAGSGEDTMKRLTGISGSCRSSTNDTVGRALAPPRAFHVRYGTNHTTSPSYSSSSFVTWPVSESGGPQRLLTALLD